ncbi:MAG: carbohydrate ABC transporter permease [Clostridiaceae bacterium]|nr:carbohydrate ABC transporter permease [Clostridiaceae bacterium]
MKIETANSENRTKPNVLETVKRFLLGNHLRGFVIRICMYILLIDLAFVFLYPFIYMVTTAFKSPEDLVDITVNYIPKGFYIKNFIAAYRSLNYNTGFINSTIVTTFSVIGHLISCSFIAYGFARYKFPGRDVLFAMVILTLIVPVQVLIFPLYIQYAKLGLINTYYPLIVPTYLGFGLRGGLFIFIFRQFYLGLPFELEDAAKVDGCNAFRTYWTIVRPIAGASTLVSGVLAMVWHWNDYFEPNIYINQSARYLLPANLPNMYAMMRRAPTDEMKTDEGELLTNGAVAMAGTFLVILPILIVYLFLQRKFMQGIERTGLVG